MIIISTAVDIYKAIAILSEIKKEGNNQSQSTFEVIGEYNYAYIYII